MDKEALRRVTGAVALPHPQVIEEGDQEEDGGEGGGETTRREEDEEEPVVLTQPFLICLAAGILSKKFHMSQVNFTKKHSTPFIPKYFITLTFYTNFNYLSYLKN
jgi:hypothetical protein